MDPKTSIPMNPFPFPVLYTLSTRFTGFGFKVAGAFPYLKMELAQAEIDLHIEEYGAIMFLLAAIYFGFGALTAFLFSVGLKLDLFTSIAISITAGLLLGLFIIVQLSMFPKIKVKKKVRNLERNLIDALRTMLVEIKSGVSLFDAISMVSDGEFEGVSKEFRKTVEKINTGELQEQAMEDMASNNPSLFFRRSVWQIVNGLKAGADVSVVMGALVDSMGKEQRNQIREYGSAMRLMSLIYMMLGVIIPALGFTFIIILATFPQTSIGEWLFWFLLLFILAAQFMFLGFMKSRRPNLMSE
ncbi:MAG: type II secretion system F family protein [Candidatus Diapherotrites archaeon]